jgi:arabinogalactan oligomer / maltooligosaccharide transport system substrate-binding protein
MNRSKFFLLLLVVLAALGGVSAVFAQDTMAPVDLIMWSQDETSDPITQQLFEQWAEANAPGSTLELVNIPTEEQRNQLLTAGLAGTGLPDLIWGPNDPIGVYVEAGILQPLDELFDLSVYNGTLAAGQIDGMTYGIPVSSGNHLMLMYNKSLVETPPDTWEELIAMVPELEAANADVEGFAYNLNEPFWFLPFVGGFGGSVFDEEGAFTMDTQEWVDAYQFVHDLKFTSEVVPAECDYDCADGLFREGGAAMILNGDWAITDYLDTEKSPALGEENLGLAPWPALESGNRPTPYTSGKFVSIPVTVEGEKLDAAVSFLEYISANEEAVLDVTVDIGRLPALTSAYELPEVAENPLLSMSASALATGIGMPANVELRCMWDSVRPQLEGVMSDSVQPADAATEAQIAAEDCLEAS